MEVESSSYQFPSDFERGLRKDLIWKFRTLVRLINGNWPRAQQTNFLMILKGIPSGFHVEVESSSDRFPIDFEDTTQELHMKIDSELSGPISYEF